ncbi:MAG TPA: hypothetical protein VK915_07345 [Gaiellaceae bacterium]|nr:hypothetical protein [Gaiellaceae bacterium]
MGWLDKLLGRDRPAPPEAPSERMGPEFDGREEPHPDATAARDEELEIEGRVPPGT